MRYPIRRFTLFTMTDQTKERIVSCACDLFLRDGFDGFSMRRLARAVGVTAPALYRHYESKEAVLHHVVGQAYQQMARYLYRALEGRTPKERLMLAGRGYLEFAMDHPRLYEALFASPELAGLGELPDEIEAQGAAIGQFWNDRIRECMDAGILRKADPCEIGLTLWAHAHGLISLRTRGLLGGPDEITDERFRDIYRASALRVLGGMGFEGRVSDEADSPVVDSRADTDGAAA